VPFLRQHLGVVFQDLELVPEWTVYEHLLMPLLVLGVNGKEAVRAAKDMLAMLGLEKKSLFRAYCLSGGEKQKLCVGRALIHRPKLVLADEPTGNLDEASAKMVLELLFEFSQREKATVIVATHNKALVGHFPARVIFLEKGRVREGEV
ncbi:MAG: ABC transporter ATP-binding protein, partial [Atribacterota bacterium]